MTIKIGDKLPAGKLTEAVEFNEAAGCPVNPQDVDVTTACAGKKIAIFSVPGAFTPTCSAQHLPGFIEKYADFKARGVDEIWCVAVNDAYVMGAWGHDQQVGDKVRMLGDGNGSWCKALGMEHDRKERSMGVRMHRFSMLVDDGVIKQLNVEVPYEFKVSDAATLFGQLG